MYLKEISTSGFKSFADKITISLDGKITAIVGPNGSGKSNIVDAVRWVLGEQSVKSLRGTDNMTDVIFSGSKSRSPLNVASVSLTFDNSDNFLPLPYSEVTIKRRVYKSGEGEYFINGEKCRLKDITDLLMDSASKESFNIISQGEIQRILSNSPYERRAIFESAAGVLKYKKRKEEALKKLDRTQSNIERVNDIINEIETRIEPLKEQSRKASEYLDAKEKLESIEVALLASEIEKINYELDVNKKKIEEINNEILSLNLKASSQDASLLDDKNTLAHLEEKLRNDNKKLLDLTTREEKLNSQKELLKERSKYDASDSKVHNNIANLKEDLYQTENAIKLMEKDVEMLNDSLGNTKADATRYELELTNLNNKKNSSITESDNKKRELYDTSHKIESLVSYIESSGGAPSSVKAVLGNPRIKGMHGVVSNVIECDDKYVKALEVSIASVKNFIIVDNEEVAKVAISYLKDNNLGRATFFPLNVIKPKGVDNESLEKIKKHDGFIGIFSDLVTFDKTYYNIVSNQLGNVIVAKDIDTANRISFDIYRRYKVVTLEGDVINVGGSMSGGSVSTSKSIVSLKNELETLKRRKIELEEAFKEEDKNTIELDKLIKDISSKLYVEKSGLIQYEEQIKAKEKLILELNNRKSDIEKELYSLENLVDSSFSQEEEKIMKEYYEVSLEKENLVKEINYSEKEKDKLSSLIEEKDAIVRVSNTSISKFEKSLKELEILDSKLDIKLDNNLRILSEDYSLTYEKARENYTLDTDIDTARSMVNKYRNIIKNIGMVNIESIEEYKTVSERYNFLNSEKNDLMNAKDTLFEIINEMDSVMKREFLDTFEKVREEFRKVFKELFNGGSADLKLTDRENVLETGIDIMASPPGKTLKSITLLSGGEMTLTAISLIFAILNIKNVPFCIFDEVEAALDEANVDNFGHYLDHYKDRTQFLIITHKKKTMEYADTLYGITMQESGVSKLVSVRLSDIDK